MENTCSNCNYWEPKAPVVADKENFGECNKLSMPEPKINKEYIIPVLNGGKTVSESNKMEFVTGSDFGCTHFARA